MGCELRRVVLGSGFPQASANQQLWLPPSGQLSFLNSIKDLAASHTKKKNQFVLENYKQPSILMKFIGIASF